MIVSHKHKFIFIKTQKTAGTSLEIALSKFCGPNDVITPISPKDESVRQDLGYRGPQNFRIPFSRYSKGDWARLLFERRRLEFFNHCSASYAKRYLGDEVWNDYFKFAFERNPFDKVISWYWWIGKERMSLDDFVLTGSANRLKGFDLYSINSEIVVDKVYKFEEMSESLVEISERLNLPEQIQMPNAKGGVRKDARPYRDILTEEARSKIEKVWAREFAHFGYVW